MGDYHQYLYDFENGRIIGDYESAYKNCDDVNPTQHNVDTLKHRIVLDHFTRRTTTPKPNVLDIGCGYGVFVDRLAGEGLDVAGCDVSESAIAKGLERFPGAQLAAGSIADGLPYEDESFDGIILFGVIWFLLDNLDGCMKELTRMLKPGGYAFISVTFALNQKLGKDIVGSPDDLHGFVSKHLTVLETMSIADESRLAEGQPPSQCEQDCLIIAKKVE